MVLANTGFRNLFTFLCYNDDKKGVFFYGYIQRSIIVGFYFMACFNFDFSAVVRN